MPLVSELVCPMFRNTGEEVPMLVGNIVAITAGAAISLGVSLVTRGPMTRDMQDTEWEKTRYKSIKRRFAKFGVLLA